MQTFAARVVAWQRAHGRTGLPWQGCDPYRVWLSEIMLQQTQVRTVLPFYARFVARFPNLHTLAAAPLEEVMTLWAGLGYYSRARNLHACARSIVADHGGAFPRRAAEIARLPGIGRSTAAAIAAFCFAERAAILDGNVKRVLARHAAIAGDPSTRAVENALWLRAESLLPGSDAVATYTQGLMDLGATVCTRTVPACAACPVREDCKALAEERVADLPTPRARKAVPTRRACFLLAIAGDSILLEQRPPTGIWGSLLVPPQFATRRALNVRLASIDGGARARALAARSHGFTHFTLSYTPYLAQIGTQSPATNEPNHRWVRLQEIESAPLPAPMQALLADVRARLARQRRPAISGPRAA